jgi:hypothetical protein
MNNRRLLSTFVLFFFCSTLHAESDTQIQKDQKQYDYLKSIFWQDVSGSLVGAAGLTGLGLLQLAIYGVTKKRPLVVVSSILTCAVSTIPLAYLAYYTLNQARLKRADALYEDFLTKQREYVDNVAGQRPSNIRKNLEYFKYSFWTSISSIYLGIIFKTSKELGQNIWRFQWKPAAYIILSFILGSLVLVPICWHTARWGQKGLANAISDDAVKASVKELSTARKTWEYAKGNILASISCICWVVSVPLMPLGVLAWFTSKWSREALIKSIHEEIFKRKVHAAVQ